MKRVQERSHGALEGDAHPGLMRLGELAPPRQYLRNLWERRDLALAIPLSQLRAENQDTVLGQFWHLLNPLFSAAVYYLIFGVILNTSRGIDNFTGFLVIGVFLFQYLSKCFQSGARVIVQNTALMQSLSFPRIILPLGSVIGETIAFLPGLGVMMLMLLATGERPSLFWLAVIPVIGTQFLFNLGLAFFAARSTFHFRDFANFLPYMTRIWFYMSGVMFSIEQRTTGKLQQILELNPAHAFITVVRDVTMHGSLPAHEVRVGLAWTASVFIVGMWFFRRREMEYGRG